jgi:CheY-like chemotaxis protein
MVASITTESQPVEELLLVEDEEISRRALALLLHSKGYQIRTAASAEEALQLLNHGGHPQMALVDLDLPGMSGLELIKHLSQQHPAIPAVLITASSIERLKEALGDHSVTYLRKPLDFNRLLNLLHV